MSPLLFLLVASAEPAEPGARVTAAQPARALVRIVRATPIRFGEPTRLEASVIRETTVRERDGELRAASLIEFY
jgi:hypothetical protein